jgi:mannose-6-phosphate isomerase-like protein (cupin superfamily)
MSTTWPQMAPDFAASLGRREPQSFQHGLAEHPLLSLEAIAELATRLPEESVTAELAAKPLVHSQTDSTRRLDRQVVAEQIRDLESNDAWFNLLNVEQVPEYSDLVDTIAREVALSGGIDPDSIGRRMGFLFASSPGAVTSAHFDIEQSLCMQLRGTRTLGLGRFDDDAHREVEVRRYWEGVYGRLDMMPEQTRSFELASGVGVYIPPYTPHWITNHGALSLSMTVAFFTRDNTDEAAVQVLNRHLRRLRLDPPPYGTRPRVDRAKATVMRGATAARSRLGRKAT